MKVFKKLSTKFNNLPYKYKLLITSLAVSIIPILILGFFSFFQSRNLLSSSKVNDINYYFSKVAASLNEKIDSSEKNLDVIFNEPQMWNVFKYTEDAAEKEAMLDTVKTVVEPYVYDIKSNNRYIQDITYYTNGFCPTYHSIVRDISEYSKFGIKWRNGDPYRYQWHYSAKRIIISRSLVAVDTDKNTHHLGYLCILINPTTLLNTTASPEIFNYNIALFSPEKECVYSHVKSQEENEKLMLKAAYAEKDVISFGSDRYLVKNEVLDNGFTLCIYANEREVIDGINSILLTTVAISLICLICVFVFCFAFSNTLTRRISLLNHKIDQVRSGNMDIVVHSEYTDEIGFLTNNFSDMIHQINDLIQNVYESKLTQQKAELRALQSQIKPHFLYNTLQAVNWNAINRNDYETSEIVVNLSNFYRAVLNKGEDDISVDDELKIIKYYLKIEQKILGGLFSVDYDIDPEILGYRTPLLILQPIVENAIEHGIRKSRVKPGEITIKAGIENGLLTFSISDNGTGIDQDKIDTILTKQSGSYGLKNVNERIQLKFGNEYGIKVTSRCNPTTFTVTMPLIPFE